MYCIYLMQPEQDSSVVSAASWKLNLGGDAVRYAISHYTTMQIVFLEEAYLTKNIIISKLDVMVGWQDQEKTRTRMGEDCSVACCVSEGSFCD